MIESLSITGYRGFGEEVTISFAQPNEKDGSGLTFLVGKNNSGKTSILETLKFFNLGKDNPPSFSERKRNTNNNGKVTIELKDNHQDEYKISTSKHGGSTVDLSKNDHINDWTPMNFFVLQSRRYFNYEFSRSLQNREWYLHYQQNSIFNRTPTLDQYNNRIFNMEKNKEKFDPLLQEIFGRDLKWMIEQNDNGLYFLKVTINGATHSSEGLGDGIWSVFTICDALFDSQEGSVIAIDEPELSLHPAYQKRVMNMLKRYAKDRQIIISTHSPYFIDWESIINGAELIRCVKNTEGNIEIFPLSPQSKTNIRKFQDDFNQPHTLGLEAKEVFFLEDNIILVEGQEDVIMYPKIAKQLQTEFKGTFFGWGAGGAEKIPFILRILQDLGYKKIQVIYDGDKKKDKEKTKNSFSQFKYHLLPTDDIRDKKAKKSFAGKIGIVTEDGKLKEEYRSSMEKLIREVNDE